MGFIRSLIVVLPLLVSFTIAQGVRSMRARWYHHSHPMLLLGQVERHNCGSLRRALPEEPPTVSCRQEDLLTLERQPAGSGHLPRSSDLEGPGLGQAGWLGVCAIHCAQ